MKRWYLAAVAGLCAVAPLSAQEGGLAPTAPVVPAPVLQNGNVLTPAGGWGGGGGVRPLSLTKWSPFRNPAAANTTEPVAPSAVTYGQMLPPLPDGVGGADGKCGPASCARGKRERTGLDRLKAWLCFQESNTSLPRCQPTPYVTPLLGTFPCTAYGGDCGHGCGTGNCAAGPSGNGAPLGAPQPLGTPEKPMTQPVPPGTTAGAVTMPSRGTQGTAVQAWPGRTTPVPATGPVVGASYKAPAPK